MSDSNQCQANDKKTCNCSAIVIFFIIGLLISLFVGWYLFPKLLYKTKKQPIDFNHKIHLDLVSDGCESCHFFRKDGSFSGVPKLAQCVDCHQEVQGGSSEEEKFVNEYVLNNKEVPWLIYSKQPDCVFFSHSAHIKKAKMECSACHGNIGESEHSKVYQENRLTKYSRDIWGKKISGINKKPGESSKMDDCAKCHKKETGSQGSCFQCHK